MSVLCKGPLACYTGLETLCVSAVQRSYAGLVHTLTTCQSDFNGLASISIDWRRFSTMKVSMTAEPGGRLSPAKVAVRPPAGWTGCHRFSVVPLSHHHWVAPCLIHAKFQYSSPQAGRVMAVSCGACFTAVPVSTRIAVVGRPNLLSAPSRNGPVPLNRRHRRLQTIERCPSTRRRSSFKLLAAVVFE